VMTQPMLEMFDFSFKIFKLDIFHYGFWEHS
jgi:hypothetical protein